MSMKIKNMVMTLLVIACLVLAAFSWSLITEKEDMGSDIKDLKEEKSNLEEEVSKLENEVSDLESSKKNISVKASNYESQIKSWIDRYQGETGENLDICYNDNSCYLRTPGSEFRCGSEGAFNKTGEYSCECNVDCDVIVH